MRKLILALIALAIYALSTNAQINGSVKLGLTTYEGDVHCFTDGESSFTGEINPAFGVGLHIPLSKVIGFRGELTYFRLSGDETNFDDPRHVARGWTFTNNLLELSALVDWEIFGKRRFKNGLFRRTLTPVIFAGVGLAFTNTDVDWNNSTDENISRDEVYSRNAETAIPVGVGLKYYLSETFALSAEVGYRLPVSDYYDGIRRTVSTDGNDSYGFGGVKAYFTLKKKADKDGDGMVDAKDDCPDIPGIKSLNGCPDSDLDGIANAQDKCPFARGAIEFGGCPDNDGDGVVDINDLCPWVAGLKEMDGCPDSDSDGISDILDSCPNESGKGSKSGCPDNDGDGIANEFDLCPEKAGPIARQGCPFSDGDDDGIADKDDACPDLPGTLATNGCPDQDGDKIADRDDKCPNLAGDAPNGCPEGVIPFPKELGIPLIVGSDSRTIVKASPPVCDCSKNTDAIFNIASEERPKTLTRLGTNPEFGNSHGLDAIGFYNKLKNAYDSNVIDQEFLDKLFRGMGYAGFSDARPEFFYETIVPYGTSGNIGYSKNHQTLFVTLNPTSERDLMAFRIRAVNGCDIHFMKTCGNHFFFCPN